MNVLFDGLDNDGIFALDQYVEQTPDDPIMITAGARHNEGIVKARQIKTDYPNKTVFYRRYPDDHQHQRIPNTNDWLNLYAPLSEGGIYVCDMNESGIGDLDVQASWMATNIRNMGRLGLHIAVWHINTHNPPSILLPKLRPVFEAAAAYPEQVYGCQHHYFDLWNDDAYTYLAAAQDYCASIGCLFPWAITELGYGHGIDAYIGFQHQLARNAGVTDEVYADLLVQKLTRLAQRRTIAFVYSFGATSPWEPFDIRKSLVLPRLVSYNVGLPPMTPTPTPIWRAHIFTPRNALLPVNVRSAQSTGTTPVLTQIPKEGTSGELDITHVRPPDVADINWWYHVRVAGIVGWVRSDSLLVPIEIVSDADPNPPAFLPSLEFDLEGRVTRGDLADWLRAVGDVVEHGVIET